ncbi:ion channel [Thalassobacillus hwangdonensis]|uniref:Ion channel n=1 Tax=Thalassobacillus hwangdonensis TaxID=546108 RepID=A0ABW3KZM1_9BACI
MFFLRKLIARMVSISNQVLFLSSTLLVSIASILIVQIEPQTFPTYFDGFWWVMTTVTTVGYGDYSPGTAGGRIVAIILYMVGIGLIGIVIGKVVEGLAKFRQKRVEGDIVVKEMNHYIIIGWSQKAKFAVREMLQTNKKTEIVIIDDLKEAPMLKDNVHYLKGNASHQETLVKANVSQAKAVLIFADDKIEDHQLVDGKTMLVASTVEALAPNVHTVVEVMEEKHLKNFEHIKVDEFIISNETISSLVVRSAFMKGVSNIYGQLLRRSFGDDLYHVPLHQSWSTYRDAFDHLLKHGATLIADRDRLDINRRLDESLPEDAELFVICDEETYNKLRRA